MNKSEYYKKHLNMGAHPEGGYFTQTYLDDGNQYSSIIFLLENGDVSNFHQLKEDELWYYHDGNSLNIYEIDIDGKLRVIKLGKNIENGECLQYLVKKGSIFGAAMENEGFSLVGCMVSPAFSYEHFKLFSRKELLDKFPQYQKEINLLTRE